jgi:hypothetical protein
VVVLIVNTLTVDPPLGTLTVELTSEPVIVEFEAEKVRSTFPENPSCEATSTGTIRLDPACIFKLAPLMTGLNDGGLLSGISIL